MYFLNDPRIGFIIVKVQNRPEQPNAAVKMHLNLLICHTI